MNFSEFIKICHSLKKLHKNRSWLSRIIGIMIKEGKLDLSRLKIFEEKFSDTIKKDLHNCPNMVVVKFLFGEIHKCVICKKYTYKFNVTCSVLCQGQYANKIRVQNNLKKYGVENVFQLENIKEKSKQTMLKKYGVEYSSQRGDMHFQLCRSTTRKHFGVDYAIEVPSIKQRISNLYIKRNLKLDHLSDDQMWTYISSISKKYIHGDKFNFTKFRSELNCSSHSVVVILKKLGLNKFLQKDLSRSLGEKNLSCQINEKIITNDRNILDGRELDILIPNLKLAIEYNGEYWHNSEHLNSTYHLSKTIKCLQKGVQLLHCFEFDNQNFFIDKVKYFQGSLRKISARKTIIKFSKNNNFIDNFIKRNSTFQDYEFLKECSKFKYLEYNNKIVFLLGINNKNECVLVPRTDVVTVGGLSKLLKGENLIVVVNRNYSDGFCLKKLGYSLVETTKPFLIKNCYNCGCNKFKLNINNLLYSK